MRDYVKCSLVQSLLSLDIKVPPLVLTTVALSIRHNPSIKPTSYQRVMPTHYSNNHLVTLKAQKGLNGFIAQFVTKKVM